MMAEISMVEGDGAIKQKIKMKAFAGGWLAGLIPGG
jgi:hypothetical protein